MGTLAFGAVAPRASEKIRFSACFSTHTERLWRDSLLTGDNYESGDYLSPVQACVGLLC